MTTKNESKANQVNESANVATAQVEQPQATATDEKVVKNTDKYLSENTKPTEVKRDVNGFKDGGTKIATATATKFEKLGKFIAKFQAIEAKDGGKTVYIFETAEKVFVGYTSSELSDIFGLEKRSYKKNGESTEESTESETLQALKNFRKSLEKVQQLGFAKTLEISEVETWITTQQEQDAEYTDFITKRGTDIEDSTTYTEESKLLEEYGTKFVAKLKTYKLGFFAPKESTEESTEQTEQTEQTEESK